VDFNDSPEEQVLRKSIRSWLEENYSRSQSKDLKTEDEWAEFRLDFERKLYQGGWSCIHWPKEYGGRGASEVEQAIFLEELARADAPEPINIIGRNLAGPTLMAFGTDEQKKRFLPAILRGEEVWAQGFSEPNSGSDLASVRCKATREGDDFVINGQKIWTSFAQYSHWIFMLVRTDPDLPKHKGLSFILVDMRSPGITIRPLVQITGETEFSEVFFDDVRVPAKNLVGGLNEGWKIAMTTLRYERGPEEAAPRQVRFRRDLERLIDVVSHSASNNKSQASDSSIREKLAASYTEIELMRLNGLRALSRLSKGEELGAEASFTKLYWSHVYQRLSEVALELLGPRAALEQGDEHAVEDGWFAFRFLQSRAFTIYSGTSEIQRNIIAERVLNMPK
jgi:alkylation response protein AidB-like acyl-CoA dehydrogenase